MGFVASGPVPAMRALLRKIHGAVLSGGDNRTWKATKGGAKPASEESWNPFCEIENATGMNVPGQSEASSARVHAELEKSWHQAIAEETDDLAAHAAKRIEKALHDEG